MKQAGLELPQELPADLYPLPLNDSSSSSSFSMVAVRVEAAEAQRKSVMINS
jgi:hypothetical protein